MNRSNRSAALLLGLVLSACESGGKPPTRPAAEPAGPALSPRPLEEQVQALASLSRPGPKHAALAPLAGSFDISLCDVAIDGKEVERFHGTATLAWILGGRFLRWDATVDFRGVPGTTTGFLGFDSRLDEYELLMISDLGQGMAVAAGIGDVAGQGIVFTVEQLDPRSGTRARSRSRLRLLAPDHFVLMQLETDASGDDHPTRAWHYRRSATVKR